METYWKRIGMTLAKLIGYTIAVVISLFAFMTPLGLLFSGEGLAVESGDFSQTNTWLLIGVWTAGLIGATLVTWLFCKFIDRQPLSWVGLTMKDWLPSTLLGLAWGGGLVTIGVIVLLIPGWLKIADIDFSIAELATWALFFFVAAAFEEVVFRGYVLNMVHRYFSVMPALIVSSLFFGVVHISNANISVIGILNIILAGFVLGVAYLKSQNLWMPTALHFAWNYFQGTIYGFEVSGNKTYSLIQQTLDGPVWLTGGDFGFEGSILGVIVLLGFLWYYRTSLISNSA
jgi:membrane protease YdiL (CAAX protease family)